MRIRKAERRTRAANLPLPSFAVGSARRIPRRRPVVKARQTRKKRTAAAGRHHRLIAEPRPKRLPEGLAEADSSRL